MGSRKLRNFFHDDTILEGLGIIEDGEEDDEEDDDVEYDEDEEWRNRAAAGDDRIGANIEFNLE
jgi:hypothetical protein